FACCSVSSLKRRRSSRAIAPASCTRDCPWLSARSRSEPIAEIEMPPTTSRTIVTLIAAIHTPRLARDVSICSLSMISWMRLIMRAASMLAYARAPFDQRLDDERDDREHRQERRHRERADEVVLVVQDLDVQRHRRGQPANVTRHDRHCAEFA